MLFILLRADNFSEAFVQGMIKYIVLGLIFFAGSAIYKHFSKQKKKDSNNQINTNIDNESGETPPEKDSNNIVATQKIITELIAPDKKKSSNFAKFNNYFFSHLNKGYKRLIFIGSFILPLLFGIILYYASGEERSYYLNPYTYYDDDALVGGFILGYFLYWLIFFLIIWVLKGFKEDKKLL